MRPQRTCAKQVDYAAIESTPPAVRRLARNDFFSSNDESQSPSPSPSPITKPKRKAMGTPDRKHASNNLRSSGAPAVPEPTKRKRMIEESPEPVSHKQSKAVHDSPVPKKLRQQAKGKKKDEELKGKENIEDPPTLPIPAVKPAKPAKSKDSKPKPASSSSSTALILSPAPPAYIPLQQQNRAHQDPILAMTNIINDEIKSASAKAVSLESEMVLAKNTKQFMKTQDHRYESLRQKFDELKKSVTQQVAVKPTANEDWKTLISQMKEAMKELSQDQTSVRKKAKELAQNKTVLEEEKKVLDQEKKRVEEEGREIEIEKRRMERKEIEKERQDIERDRFVNREEKKELTTHRTKVEEDAKEVARRRKYVDEEKAECDREKRKIAEELAKETQKLESWRRQLEAEKRKMEEERWRWDDERKNITQKQEAVVSQLKWQVESEKQIATKSKMDNEDLADKLTTATHRWAEHQEQMDRELAAMVKLVKTSENDSDTIKFMSMITGLRVSKLAPNKFQCECGSGNKSRVKFEVTIREEDVEYTPLEVVGGGMPECVKEGIFFLREDWPIFLCKIIASVFRP